MLIFAQMLRFYNWAFTHESLMNMSFNLFIAYYEQLWIMLEMEWGKSLKDIENKNKPDRNQIKSIFKN